MSTLRDLLGVDILSPFWNNLIVSQLMVIYYKIGSELILKYCIRWRLSCRQALHILLSSCVLFWPLFIVRDDVWSWRLNILVPSVMMARFYYKGAILKDPDDIEVQIMSRSSSPSELLWGPMQWAAVLVYLGLYRFGTAESAIQVAAVGVGDALAPWLGSWYGRHVYQMPFAGQKTMEGSVVGVFLGTCVGIYLCLPALGLRLLPLREVLVYGTIAAVVEGTSPGHSDNLTVPFAIHFSLNRVGKWLPE